MDNNNPTGSSTRRKLSIEDVPENIRDVAGAQMDQIQIRPNNNIANTIHQLNDATSQGVGNAQFLDLLAEGNQKLTTVARQGIETPERVGEMDDRERWLNQWYESRKKVWGGIRNQLDEQIQFIGSHIHQDVLAKIVTGCESFRGELEIQLVGMREMFRAK